VSKYIVKDGEIVISDHLEALDTGQLSLLNAGKLLPESSRATTPATQRPRFAGVSGANDACAPLWEPPLCDA
jgi:hypothetical protein